MSGMFSLTNAIKRKLHSNYLLYKKTRLVSYIISHKFFNLYVHNLHYYQSFSLKYHWFSLKKIVT